MIFSDKTPWDEAYEALELFSPDFMEGGRNQPPRTSTESDESSSPVVETW